MGDSSSLNGWQIQVQKGGDEWEPVHRFWIISGGPMNQITSLEGRNPSSRWPDVTPSRLLNGLSEKPPFDRDPPQASPRVSAPTKRFLKQAALVLHQQTQTLNWSRRLTEAGESPQNTSPLPFISTWRFVVTLHKSRCLFSSHHRLIHAAKSPLIKAGPDAVNRRGKEASHLNAGRVSWRWCLGEDLCAAVFYSGSKKHLLSSSNVLLSGLYELTAEQLPLHLCSTHCSTAPLPPLSTDKPKGIW